MLHLRQTVRWDGWPPTVAATLAIVGANKSQVYEMLGRLPEALRAFSRRPGRPPAETSDKTDMAAVMKSAFAYVAEHPGCMRRGRERAWYDDGYRRLVIGMTGAGQLAERLSIGDLSEAVMVPVGTLKCWLRDPKASSVDDSSKTSSVDDSSNSTDAVSENKKTDYECARKEDTPDAGEPITIRSTHLKTIGDLWLAWSGPFSGFCHMVRTEHRLYYSDNLIARYLHALGLREPNPRRPIEAPWSSGTFCGLFPGAQWLGDGTSIAVRWRDRIFVFNLEAMMDVASNAVTGFHVSDSEDEEAVLLALQMGVTTTGGKPLMLTLDNRNSNHSPTIINALGGTTLVPSTLGRGQAKAPLEGAFGLFQQAMPPIAIDGLSARDMARCVLDLVMTAWFRGRNGRPRKRLKGKSPAEAYVGACPTQAEIDEALAHIAELQRRQERMRRTRNARRDPVRTSMLTQGLTDLGIPDPDGRLAVSLAIYSPESIARGLATFRAKQGQGTIPADADPGRYLGGIIRNLDTKLELERLAEHLLTQRIRLRDLTLASLTRDAENLRNSTPTASLTDAFVHRALTAEKTVDFRFWAQTAADELNRLPEPSRIDRYRTLSRQIAATFKSARQRREDLIDRLAAALSQTAAA